jgi:hypothetical protein
MAKKNIHIHEYQYRHKNIIEKHGLSFDIQGITTAFE